MVEQYLVVSSGTLLSEEQLNGLGASSWVLVDIERSDGDLVWYHVFRKTS